MTNKTVETKESVTAFINAVEDPQKRRDCKELVKLMKKVTGHPAKMWGPSIVGFGNYHYKYESGREGDFLQVGFSPRKQALTIYIMAGFKRYEELMKKLGRFTTGKSCLYVKKLEDIDMKVLEKLVAESVAFIKKKYPA